MQNFFSAATGIAVVVALIRGFARARREPIGNFWVDLDAHRRSTCCCRCRSSSRSFLVGQGVVQNFDAYRDVTTLEVNAYQQPKTGPTASR